MTNNYVSKQAAIDIVVSECGKWTGLAKEISKQLKQLPSADVAPVVHSTWIENGDPLMLTCGNCGYGVMRYNNTRFCPNCGAKMDGERKE